MQKFEDQMKSIYKKYLIEPQSEKPESGTWKGAGSSSYYIDYWKCSNCGAVMTWKGRFCPGCGFPMVNADEPDV
jgi:rubrerythrin